jgi:hypothetical protein
MNTYTRLDTRYRNAQPPLAALLAAALALVLFGYLLHGLSSVPATMGVVHIGKSAGGGGGREGGRRVLMPVAFKLKDAAHLPALNAGMLALKEQCALDGRAYIRSAVGGRQSSPEGHEKGMQVVFVLEFEVRRRGRGLTPDPGARGLLYLQGPGARRVQGESRERGG